MIYLDNAATSFPKPDTVYDTMLEAMKEYGANPGRSGHDLALKASRGMYDTRELLARLFNIENPMNIAFTFNATDGLNIGIKGLLQKGDHVITTSIEHNSVLRPLMALKQEGVEVTIIQCDEEGYLDLKELEDNIKENTKLIVTTHCSNVTGTILPIDKISRICKKHDIIYMVDGAQSAGVYDINVKELEIDILAFPGHKGLLGPQGTGGLYVREGIEINEIKQGGTGSKSHELIQPKIMPDKYESGTPNAPGIIALGAGVKYIMDKGIENIRKHEFDLTKHFIEGISKIDKVKYYGPKYPKERGAVVPINIEEEDSSEVSYILNNVFNIGTRPGLHCAPLTHKTIGTFEQGVVRFSFGVFTTHEEINRAINALKEIAKEI